MPNDPERNITESSIGLSCHLYGQTLGASRRTPRNRNHSILFRARHEHWEFTACVSHDIDPSWLNPGNVELGFFTDGEYPGYLVGSEASDAGNMRYDDS